MPKIFLFDFVFITKFIGLFFKITPSSYISFLSIMYSELLKKRVPEQLSKSNVRKNRLTNFVKNLCTKCYVL